MDKANLPKIISAELRRGLSLEEIKSQLLARGFFDYDINEAIADLCIEKDSTKEEEKPREKTESIEGWDENLPNGQ